MKSTVELPLSPGYVKDWTVYDAFRELIQNGMDAHDSGHPLHVSYGEEKGTVRIVNQGASLDRSTLLLGQTSKSAGLSRGQFGEGYKLALLVLARLNYSVIIRTGKESWQPELSHSSTFNAETLKIKIRDTITGYGAVEIRVLNVPKDVWEHVTSFCIDVPGMPTTKLHPKYYIAVGKDKILTHEHHRGHLFSRGLYVGNLPDCHAYGYDLSGLILNRDRKLPSVWSLRTNVAQALRKAAESQLLSPELALKLAEESSSGESLALHDFYRLCATEDKLTSLVTAGWQARNESAVPVQHQTQIVELAHFGLTGIQTSPAVKMMVELELGSYDDRQAGSTLQVSKTYEFSELTRTERETLYWAVKLVRTSRPQVTVKSISIVDYLKGSTQGTWDFLEKRMCLARSTLSSAKETLSTIVHEIAHAPGYLDGTIQHRAEIEEIYGTIVCCLASAPKAQSTDLWWALIKRTVNNVTDSEWAQAGDDVKDEALKLISTPTR